MSSVRAVVLEGPRSLSLQDLDRPEIGLRDGLLDVELVGICGTDYKFYCGKLEAPYPIVLGHEILGRVAELGPEAEAGWGLTSGQRVLVEANIPCWACSHCFSGQYRFCQKKQGYGTRTSVRTAPGLWGAMADVMYLAPGSVLHAVPDDLSPQTLMASGLVANGIQWLRDSSADVSVGDTVVVKGAGPQALAAICVARECGAGLIVVTGLPKDESRLALAQRLGADVALTVGVDDVPTRLHELTAGRLADIVLEVTGDPASIKESIELIQPQGTLVLAGLTGNETVTDLNLDRLVWNEIRVQGVFSKGDAAMSRGIRFLCAKADSYPLDEIVSHVYSLVDAEAAVRAAGDTPPAGFTKAAIAPHLG